MTSAHSKSTNNVHIRVGIPIGIYIPTTVYVHAEQLQFNYISQRQ